ncbi:MAG: metallophosphoesterase [Clostridia bacterium]|nr:metallophosphoesterase [Clostridia bacterium]
MKTKIGVISDLHLFNKTVNIERALLKLYNVDLLLIVGDIADRADEKQYDIFLNLFDERFTIYPCIVFLAITTILQKTIQATDSLKENSTMSIHPLLMNAAHFTNASMSMLISLVSIPYIIKSNFSFPTREYKLTSCKND